MKPKVQAVWELFEDLPEHGLHNGDRVVELADGSYFALRPTTASGFDLHALEGDGGEPIGLNEAVNEYLLGWDAQN
jgi:hypothetical protein